MLSGPSAGGKESDRITESEGKTRERVPGEPPWGGRESRREPAEEGFTIAWFRLFSVMPEHLAMTTEGKLEVDREAVRREAR